MPPHTGGTRSVVSAPTAPGGRAPARPKHPVSTTDVTDTGFARHGAIQMGGRRSVYIHAARSEDRCHRCPPQAVFVPSVPASFFFGKNRNSDGRERCSTTVPQMLRATTAHLLSFFHINVVGPCPHFITSGPSPPRTRTVGDTPQRHAPRAARVLRVPGHGGGPPVAQERDLPTTRGRADSCTLAKTDCGVARYSGRRSHIGLCQICACGASAFQPAATERVPPVDSRSDATRRGRRGYFACWAMVVGHRSRRSATKGGAV